MVQKNIVYLSLTSFFTDTATAMVVSILPVYLVHHLGAGYDKLGIVVAVATFISYLFRVLFGFLSDHFGNSKIFLFLGYGLSALSKPLFAFAPNWQSIAFLRALDRLGKAIRSAPRDRLLSLSGEKQGKIFGFHKTFDVAGETLGSITAFAFLHFFFTENSVEAIKFLFLASALPGILALLTLLPVKEIKPPFQNENLSAKFLKEDLKLLPFLGILASISLFMWPLPFLLAQLKDFKMEESIVPLFYLLTNMVQIITSYPLGKLLDYLNPKLVLISIPLIGIFSIFLFQKGFLIVSFVLYGLFQVLFFNFFRAFIGRYATNKGSIYGIFYTLYGILASIGALIVGFLIQKGGLTLAFLYTLFGLILLDLTATFLRLPSSKIKA